MDKSWMHADRRSLKFKIGLEDFLKFALANASDIDKICCPCLKCCNNDEFSIGVINDHIYFNGIDVRYKQWKWHGEPSAMNADILGESETVDMGADFGIGDEDDEISSDSNEFIRFVEDGDKPLYPGCTKTTKLNGLIQTFNLKAKHGMADSCYSDMLIMIGMLLPEGNEVPGSIYEAKKTLATLGMTYERIHACPNDCILYRGQHAEATSCPTYGESRWKLGRDNTNKEGVPGKVLWYFPPIPRFKRMFLSTKTAKDLTWHANDRKTDGMMRHPVDSPTWKLVDTKWPEFGSEPRNLRLALSSDGFNPHSSLSSWYSCWPVILVTYNLPPWLCMKRKHMMLTLLISGPKQPGNDIDVYLQPLIDDLKQLWDGVEVYDALRGESFKLKAVLFWTINDFPAYGNLSGSITKGYNACPVCVDETRPYRLKHSNKMAFMRHRRFLPRHHPYRRQAATFDNTIEEDVAPSPLSGEEMLSRVEGLNIPFGKKKPSTLYKGVEVKNRPCWKKKSVFFELDYWKHLPVRHILDVMHIEKNCCDAILGTLLNIPGKTKDGAASRLDMVDMGIRTDLKPTPSPKRAKLPLASWNLLLDEKKILCSSFFNMTVPVRFCSNIRNLVSMEDLRLVGLKSHDCHTIMQILLPVALRLVLEKPVRYAIIRFCLFFKAICSKVIDVSKLQQMQADLIDTVCLLEKFFPPSFFDVMIHLTVHLVREVELCGPVFLRWMYPFERYMKVFKGYVRSRHFPKGCIAENYIVEEAIEFCSERMLPKDDTTMGIPSRSLSGLCNGSKPLSGATMVTVSAKELRLAHLCVLRNTEDAMPYFKEHMELLELTFPKFKKNERWLREKQNATFGDWLKEWVANAMRVPDNDVSETMRWMAGGPRREDLENLPKNLPLPVKDLCMWAKTGLTDGATIHTTFGGEIFGHSRKAVIFRRDIFNMANMLEVSGGVIVLYMSYLYGVLKKSKMLDMVGFIDPAHTGIIGCGNPTEWARSMSNRYMLGKPGQIFLVPYNSGAHWMLSVVNPDEEVVHFMDPLKRRLCAGEWKAIVDNSIKIFNAQKGRKGKKIIQWKNLTGIPEQTDSKTCGYFILRYMKEIVEDKNLEFANKWDRKSNLAYTQKDIDVVRAEWANHVMKF